VLRITHCHACLRSDRGERKCPEVRHSAGHIVDFMFLFLFSFIIIIILLLLLLSSSSSSSYHQALRSIVVIAFQCNLHLFPRSLTNACPFFPSSVLCKSSSSSYLHLLHGLPFFLVPPIETLAILLKFFGFVFFQHDHNILVGGSLQILQYIPFLIYLSSPCLFCSSVFSSFYR